MTSETSPAGVTRTTAPLPGFIWQGTEKRHIQVACGSNGDAGGNRVVVPGDHDACLLAGSNRQQSIDAAIHHVEEIEILNQELNAKDLHAPFDGVDLEFAKRIVMDHRDSVRPPATRSSGIPSRRVNEQVRAFRECEQRAGSADVTHVAEYRRREVFGRTEPPFGDCDDAAHWIHEQPEGNREGDSFAYLIRFTGPGLTMTGKRVWLQRTVDWNPYPPVWPGGPMVTCHEETDFTLAITASS